MTRLEPVSGVKQKVEGVFNIGGTRHDASR